MLSIRESSTMLNANFSTTEEDFTEHSPRRKKKPDLSLKSRKISFVEIEQKKIQQNKISRPFARRISYPLSNSIEVGYDLLVDHLVEAINKFSFEFYNITAAYESKNMVFSPLSAFKLMHMIYLCSNNKTEVEISRLLHLKTNTELLLDKQESNKAFILLDLLLQKHQKEINNLIFTCNTYSKENFLLPDYEERLKLNTVLSFNENINKIEERYFKLNRYLLNNVELNGDNLYLILSNSLEFKQNWEIPFVPAQLENQDLNVELMKIPNSKLMYAKNPNNMPMKICEFPFQNNSYVFTVLLPNKGCMSKVEKYLDFDSFNSLTRVMKLKKVSITFPKFMIEDQYDVKKILKSLNADASFLDFEDNPHGLSVDKSLYHASISVDYNCVAASAETNIFLTRELNENSQLSIRHNSEQFRCEKPFVFFIRHIDSKLILFMGKLMIPK